MSKGNHILVLTTIAFTLLATAGSLCPSMSGTCQMTCCAPGHDSGLALRAASCCRIGPVPASSSTAAVKTFLPDDAGKRLGQVAARGPAPDAQFGAIIARYEADVSSLNHRDPVPTYLLGCSILR